VCDDRVYRDRGQPVWAGGSCLEAKPVSIPPSWLRWRMPDAMRGGVGMDDYLRLMDEAGVEHSLLIAVRAGDPAWRGSFEIPYAPGGPLV